jgi:hypothetical protein
VLVFPDGAIILDLTDWGVNHQPRPIENPDNCSYTTVLEGPVPIVQNELNTVNALGALDTPPQTFSLGSYTNLQGSFYVRATFAGFVDRNSTDTCDFSQIGTTKNGLDFAVGVGVVSGAG